MQDSTQLHENVPIIKSQKKSQHQRQTSPTSDRKKKKQVTIKSDECKRKARKHKKKQKLLRPCSPASYPSPLPIRGGVFDDSTEEEDEPQISNDKITTSNRNGIDVIDERSEKYVTKSETDRKGKRYSPSGSMLLCGSNVNMRTSKKHDRESFLAFRLHYLIVHIAIMLADGLQGTHLYVLYEGYGYTVASLYCLGFVSGAITSPFIGPLVDKIGRRNSAIAYCVLEIAINLLEQYDLLTGLIISRVVGGVTTNLLFTVFESWLVTEHRRRGFSEEKLETVLRDSVVASNFSAIASGCIAHLLASKFGAKGPFEGAVACTFVALVLVFTRWEENYGSDIPGVKSIRTYMSNAFTTIISDSKIYRIGIIQGLTEGALQTFVFLWSPALRHFAIKLRESNSTNSAIGLDMDGQPAYGLIFGAFMACGAIGGMFEPTVRKLFVGCIYQNGLTDVSEVTASENQVKKDDGNKVLICSSSVPIDKCDDSDVTFDDSSAGRLSGVNEDSESDADQEFEDDDEKPLGVELLAALCFFVCAGLLATPVVVDETTDYAFTLSLGAFLVYECIVGLYMPCEGVLRTIYMPNDSICSLMTMLRVIVNVAVALGVISTNYIPFTTAFAACSGALVVAACLQLSLVHPSEWVLVRAAISKLLRVSTGPIASDSIIQISQPLEIDGLDIGSPVPEAKRLNDSVTSPATCSVSSLNYEEPSNQREIDSCVEPNDQPGPALQSIRRRYNTSLKN